MPLTQIRVPLGFVIGAFVLYLATPSLRSIVTGLPLALFGLLFRGVAAGVIRKDHSLAVCGPYQISRNPLYFGSFLIAVGFSVMSRNLICAALLLIPFTIIYSIVIRQEESHLWDKFGKEYQKFKNEVPRFFPRRFSFLLFKFFSTRQYVSNREYNAAFGFAAASAILVVKYLLESR